MNSIPLPQLLSSWEDVRRLVKQRTGSYRRAEAVLGGMRLQAWYGECFASAAFLGGKGLLSNKAWLRCIHQLEVDGLVTLKRNVRAKWVHDAGGRPLGGTYGTFSVDFQALWRWALEIIRHLIAEKGRPRDERGRSRQSSHGEASWRQALDVLAQWPPGEIVALVERGEWE